MQYDPPSSVHFQIGTWTPKRLFFWLEISRGPLPERLQTVANRRLQNSQILTTAQGAKERCRFLVQTPLLQYYSYKEPMIARLTDCTANCTEFECQRRIFLEILHAPSSEILQTVDKRILRIPKFWPLHRVRQKGLDFKRGFITCFLGHTPYYSYYSYPLYI